jgi:hypothetical protein
MPETADEVPESLAGLVEDRDQDKLSDDALVRYQLIGLGPGISHNHRFVLMRDGRIFAAHNTSEEPSTEQETFNTPLPDEPTTTLPEETVAQVEEQLDASGFFDSPAYVADEGVRDGSLVIVTVQRDGQEHEVWYRTVHTPLTDLLSSIFHEATAEPLDLEQILADLQGNTEEEQ